MAATHTAPGFDGLRFSHWQVERREDGVLVGMCGLFKRAALPEPDLTLLDAERTMLDLEDRHVDFCQRR